MAVTVLHFVYERNVYKIGAPYEDVHDAETGVVADAGEMINTLFLTDNFKIYRNFFFYDTSGVGTVEGARIVANMGRQEADENHSDVYIMEGRQNILIPIPSDYGAHRDDDPFLGVIRYEDIGAYPNYIILNEAGRNWINTSGNTLFCSRLRGDVKNWEPTGDNRIPFRLSGPDEVITDAASDVGAGIATLNGTFWALRGIPPYLEITHDGSNPTYPRFRFEWSILGEPLDTYTDWQYGKPLGGAFSADLTDLSAGIYRYQTVYEDAGGQERGNRVYFEITIPIIEERYFAWII